MVYTEDITEGLKDFIVNNYSSYLDAVSADRGDGLALPMINEHDIYEGVRNAASFREYPVLIIQPDDGDYEWQAMGWDLLSMNIVLWVLVKGLPEDEQQQQIKRYEAAFRNMVIDDETLGGIIDDGTVTNFRFVGKINNEDIDGVRMTLLVRKQIPNR